MSATRAVAAAILLAACGGEEPVASIKDFHARSEIAACVPLPGPQPGPASVEMLHAVSDSTFLLVDPALSQVLLLDADARSVISLEFAERGPRGIAQMLDAALSGDSLLVVADGGLSRLRAFGLSGDPLWTMDIDFPPQAVAFAGERLLVAAVGMDPRIPGLLHEREGNRLVPLQVPFVTHPDALARMFINSVVLHGFGDGSAVAAHMFVWPRAWLIPAHGRAERGRVPIPDEAADVVGLVPPMPLREEDLEEMAAPVLAITVDPTTHEIFYLTRTGRHVDGHTEKAIVHVAPDLSYLGAVRLDFNATRLAYLPSRPDSVLVVDNDIQWHRCPLPTSSKVAVR